MLMCMGIRRIFSRGAVVDFSKSFCRGAKVVKFVVTVTMKFFYHSKPRKQPFLLKNSCPLPTPMFMHRKEFVPHY